MTDPPTQNWFWCECLVSGAEDAGFPVYLGSPVSGLQVAWKEDLGNVFSHHTWESNYFTMCPGTYIMTGWKLKTISKQRWGRWGWGNSGGREASSWVLKEVVRNFASEFLVKHCYKFFQRLLRDKSLCSLAWNTSLAPFFGRISKFWLFLQCNRL